MADSSTGARRNLLLIQIKNINDTITNTNTAQGKNSSGGQPAIGSSNVKHDAALRENDTAPLDNAQPQINEDVDQIMQKHTPVPTENVEIAQIFVAHNAWTPDFQHEGQPLSTTQVQALKLIQNLIDSRAGGEKVKLSKFLNQTGRISEDTLAITNADVYLRNSELFVGYGGELLTVEDYLLSIGVPPTQKFTFGGRIPPWAKPFLPKREVRVVQHDFDSIGPRQLTLWVGFEVTVYEEKTSVDGWAFGRRHSDNTTGWFPVFCV